MAFPHQNFDVSPTVGGCSRVMNIFWDKHVWDKHLHRYGKAMISRGASSTNDEFRTSNLCEFAG